MVTICTETLLYLRYKKEQLPLAIARDRVNTEQILFTFLAMYVKEI